MSVGHLYIEVWFYLTRLSKRFWALRHRFEEPEHGMLPQTNQELY
jgi:hypothetical protein